MDKHDSDTPDESRRAFFRGAGALGVMAAAASGAAAATPQPEPAQALDAPQAKGYRLTEHIQKYYSTARYW